MIWDIGHFHAETYCLLCSLLPGHPGPPRRSTTFSLSRALRKFRGYSHHSLVLCLPKLPVAHSSSQSSFQIYWKVAGVFISSLNQGLKSHSFPWQKAANTGSFMWTVKSLRAIGRTAHPYIFWELGDKAPEGKTVGGRGMCLAWRHLMKHWTLGTGDSWSSDWIQRTVRHSACPQADSWHKNYRIEEQ